MTGVTSGAFGNSFFHFTTACFIWNSV